MTEAPLDFEQTQESEAEFVRGLREPGAGDHGLIGLAFSGGGIRSATFNLGVVEALARLKLLHHFDYLSTVSGGGYVGSWLTAFIHRKAAGNPRVAEQLIADPPEGSESGAIRFLRRYSNYLTPKLGLFSGDTLAAIATYLRNFGLNLIAFIALGMAAMLAPHLLVHGLRDFGVGAGNSGLLALATVVSVVVIGFAGWHLSTATVPTDRPTPRLAKALGVFFTIVIPLMAIALLVALSFTVSGPTAWPGYTAAARDGAIVFFLGWTFGFAILRFRHRNERDAAPLQLGLADGLVLAAMTVVSGAAGGAALRAVLGVLLANDDPLVSIAEVGWTVGAGTPVAALIIAAAVALHVGLMRRYLSHEAREWWSRAGGLVLAAIVAWALWFALGTYGPAVVRWLRGWAWEAGGTWAVVTGAGVWLAKSPLTGTEKSPRWAEIATRLVPWVFILGVGILLASATHRLLAEAACGAEACTPLPLEYDCVHRCDTLDLRTSPCDRVACMSCVERDNKRVAMPFCAVAAATRGEIASFDPRIIAQGLAIALVVLGIAVWRIDINLFSIHHFYRNRLTRAYLGATRVPERDPHGFTGFSPEDDLRLCSVGGQRPFHIVNAAVGVTGGEELAWQTRRAASFTFTPLFSGFELRATKGALVTPGIDRHGGYRPTAHYQSARWGTFLGTAMAISGAAACPNMGHHTRPELAVLLTLFNVRLGQWCGNPAHPSAWQKNTPGFGLRYLLKELTGAADAKSPFVYVSDGGHFENLGIYELVRRRCAFIVACDAGADPDYAFDDMANAIRKCAIDLGAEIVFGDQRFNAIRPWDGFRHTACHHVLGTVRYADGTQGRILYLKASLTGEEAPDILNYAANHPTFPHDTTADQFFDEDQFESYRRLGEHIATEVFEGLKFQATNGDTQVEPTLGQLLGVVETRLTGVFDPQRPCVS